MTRKNEWLTKFDGIKETSVRLAYNKTTNAQGMGNVTIQGNDGKRARIEKVFYIQT